MGRKDELCRFIPRTEIRATASSIIIDRMQTRLRSTVVSIRRLGFKVSCSQETGRTSVILVLRIRVKGLRVRIIRVS
jgi:hypothetical protein